MNGWKHFLTAVFVSMAVGSPAALAFVPNGDFETGDLSGYTFAEGSTNVATSSLISNADDGTGNRVAELRTGYTTTGIQNVTLFKDFGVLPSDVEDLFFDVHFDITGPDSRFLIPGTNEFLPYQGPQRDFLMAYVENDSSLKKPLLELDNGTYYLGPGGQIDIAPSGFLHITTDITEFAGTNSRIYFTLEDHNNEFASRVQIDNIGLSPDTAPAVAPEPSTMLLLGGGLAGMFLRSRNRKRS